MSDDFFARLAPFTSFADVVQAARFVEVPSDWIVVITDVRGSTKAIEQGRYKDVNALGVASIVAALNAAGKVEVPYVFGGDGATLVIPSSIRGAVGRALASVRSLATARFSLELRVGFVPMADVVARDARVVVARYQTPGGFGLAMFGGGGLSVAERLVKDPATAATYHLTENVPADPSLLEGFECRWNPLPSQRGAVVSAIVVSRGGVEAHERVLGHLSTLEETRALSPASLSNLSLASNRAAFSAEARLRGGAEGSFKNAFYVGKTAIVTALGRYLVRSGRSLAGFDGAAYPAEVVSNTDYRKFDDCLRMVLDLTLDEASAFEAFLEEERSNGTIHYGLHRAEAALMTCIVKSYQGNHIHFVDGSDGGYAMAAKALKKQMATASG